MADVLADSDPLTVVTAMVAAVNAHHIDRSMACFSPNTVLTLRPELPGLRDRTHRGSDYVRGWLQGLFNRDFRMAIAVVRAEGNEIQTRTTTSMSTTRRLGVAPLVGIEDYVIEDGKITSLTWTATAETLQKFTVLRRRFLIAGCGALAALVLIGWWMFRR